MEQAVLDVKGMSCGHCVKAVEDSVGGMAGVNSVKVELDAGKVQVDFDGNAVSLDDIKAEIEDQGYDVA